MLDLAPDPRLLYPLVCQVQTPHGLIDLNARLPERGGITVTEMSADEVQKALEATGSSLESAGCDPLDPTDPDATTGTGPSGFKVSLRTTLGAEYRLIRPARFLRLGDTCTLLENYSERYTLRAWAGLIVTAAPGVEFYQHAGASEFHNVTLEFLHAGGLP